MFLKCPERRVPFEIHGIDVNIRCSSSTYTTQLVCDRASSFSGMGGVCAMTGELWTAVAVPDGELGACTPFGCGKFKKVV